MMLLPALPWSRRSAVAVSTLLAAACVVDGEDVYRPPNPAGDSQPAKLGSLPVERVIDGDTIEITIDGATERVRMKGVDTPELHPEPSGSSPEPFAETARTYTSTHVGTEVDLEFDTRTCPEAPLVNCRDSYGRLLAYVRVVDGSDLGTGLIAEGLGYVYIYRDEQFDRRAEYCELQEQACAAGLGIWSDPSPAQSSALVSCGSSCGSTPGGG